MSSLADDSIDIAFCSNFFEHVDRDVILATMLETKRVLRPGGRFLILQPNIRFCAKDYWQFFDHITPVVDRALVEALEASGYRMHKVIERFLPYWESSIVPDLRAGLVTLVAAHGNSLRALVKHLDGISDEDIAGLNIPTGMPLVYELDEDLQPTVKGGRYLDPEAAAEAAAAVANQGR